MFGNNPTEKIGTNFGNNPTEKIGTNFGNRNRDMFWK